MTDERSSHAAYRAVLLAAGLLLFGLLFRQLVTLLLAILMTVIIAIPIAAAGDRMQRRGLPRAMGALAALFGGILVLALVIYLLIPPFVEQTDQFVEAVPEVVNDLEGTYADITGEDPGRVGDRVQAFFEKFTDDPQRLIGPLTSIGLNVAGIAGAFILMLLTAYYMAIRPEPLVDGLLSVFPPSRREHVRHVLDRLRASWIGWMQGVGIDMAVTFVLLFLGLTLIGLEFAVFFAVLSALLVVVPYFGAIVGAVPPTLFALTDSPGKAALTLAVYVLVQQLESNVTIPVVMANRTRTHPAVIAIGVVVVGQLFGFVGLFVAVPILTLVTIVVQEFWVRPLEEADARRRRGRIALPDSAQLDDGDHGADEDEDDDQDLDDDPEAGKLHPGTTR